MDSHSVDEIVHCVAGELAGPGDLMIRGVEQLGAAQPDQVTFIRDQRHAGNWATCRAGAALVTRGVEVQQVPGRALIFVGDADLALAQVLGLFAPPAPLPPAGIHPRATIDPTAVLGQGLTIGPGCYIGPRARLGDGCILHANVSVLDGAALGAGCVLYPGVVIHERCELGDRCVLHPNVVIGADGFGYRPAADGRGIVKIPHIGTVLIGKQVEIGACTCVDRAKFSATVIGEGTKIDNLCQIGHNVRIGRWCVIAAHAAIAGSVTVGDAVAMGGNVMIRDHVKIGNGARLAGAAAVVEDVPDGESWGGYPAQHQRVALREQAALRRLPDLVRLLQTLKKRR